MSFLAGALLFFCFRFVDNVFPQHFVSGTVILFPSFVAICDVFSKVLPQIRIYIVGFYFKGNK